MYTLIVIGLFSSINGGISSPVVNVPNLSYQECTIQGKQITNKLDNAMHSNGSLFACALQADK